MGSNVSVVYTQHNIINNNMISKIVISGVCTVYDVYDDVCIYIDICPPNPNPDPMTKS